MQKAKQKILGVVRKIVVSQKMVYWSRLQGEKHSNTYRYCEHFQRRRLLQEAILWLARIFRTAPKHILNIEKVFDTARLLSKRLNNTASSGWMGIDLSVACRGQVQGLAPLNRGPNQGLLDVKLTAGNVDDRKALKEMDTSLFGKLFSDKGYISCSDNLSREYKRLTFPNISMVITFLLPPKN